VKRRAGEARSSGKRKKKTRLGVPFPPPRRIFLKICLAVPSRLSRFCTADERGFRDFGSPTRAKIIDLSHSKPLAAEETPPHATIAAILIKGVENQVGWMTQLPWSAATLDQRTVDALRAVRAGGASITELGSAGCKRPRTIAPSHGIGPGTR